MLRTIPQSGAFLLDAAGRQMLDPVTGAFLIQDPNAPPCCFVEGEECGSCPPDTTPARVHVTTSGILEYCQQTSPGDPCSSIQIEEIVNGSINGGWTLVQTLPENGWPYGPNPCGWFKFLPAQFHFWRQWVDCTTYEEYVSILITVGLATGPAWVIGIGTYEGMGRTFMTTWPAPVSSCRHGGGADNRLVPFCEPGTIELRGGAGTVEPL